jgi:23S rRNA-/tRNA-specific pseudouridylate synthase
VFKYAAAVAGATADADADVDGDTDGNKGKDSGSGSGSSGGWRLTAEFLPALEAPGAILYEDASVLVVNKPVGLVIHPAPDSNSHLTGTLLHGLLHRYPSLLATAPAPPPSPPPSSAISTNSNGDGAGDADGIAESATSPTATLSVPLAAHWDYGIVHRLDKHTSGAMVVAKTQAVSAHVLIITLFSQRIMTTICAL